MAFDALKNPIVLGGKYGYTTRDGGWSTVVIGFAKNETPSGRVTLEGVTSTTYLYGEKSDYNKGASGRSSVNAFLLFPIA